MWEKELRYVKLKARDCMMGQSLHVCYRMVDLSWWLYYAIALMHPTSYYFWYGACYSGLYFIVISIHPPCRDCGVHDVFVCTSADHQVALKALKKGKCCIMVAPINEVTVLFVTR